MSGTFNPILVWFYQSWATTISKNFASFQSHFGLILSSVLQRRNWILRRNFQSHFGLILSFCKAAIPLYPRTPFNPILVWFYLSVRLPSRYIPVLLSIPFWSDFIANEDEVSEHGPALLSIPFWSDFILWLVQWQELGAKFFQSHFGLILSNLCIMLLLTYWCLSIPFWSDFIITFVRSEFAYIRTFQSHFGLILSTIRAGGAPAVRIAFNPILVWFYLTVSIRKCLLVFLLSIPFWSDFI